MSYMYKRGQTGREMFATSTRMNQKNLNNYLDLDVYMHNEINKIFLFNNNYGRENIFIRKGPKYREDMTVQTIGVTLHLSPGCIYCDVIFAIIHIYIVFLKL